MADKKISQLPNGNIEPNSIFPIVTSGITSKTSFTDLVDALDPYFSGDNIINSGTIGYLPKTTIDGDLIDSLIKESGYTISLGGNLYLSSGTTNINFEGNTLTPLTSLSTIPWITQSGVTHSGSVYAAKSGVIIDSQSTIMTYTATTQEFGTTTFSCYYKISSEAGYDKLNIKLNGVNKLNIGGNIDWTLLTFNLVANSVNTIDFIYSKDDGGSVGSDSAYIDDINILYSGFDKMLGNFTSPTISATTYQNLPIYWSAGTGINSTALINAGNTASGLLTVAEGYQTSATTDYSHSEGSFTLANGFGSHSEGNSTKATGSGSHAEGLNTIASGAYSHAEGVYTIANGTGAHAEGQGALASGAYSHAKGFVTQANGPSSHASGQFTIANGEASFVHGTGSTVNGMNSIVLGRNITGATADTTYVDNLNIKTVPTTGTSVNNLGVDSTGRVVVGSKIGTTAPLSATDTGTTGEIRVAAGFIYWCTAPNTWIRVAGATW